MKDGSADKEVLATKCANLDSGPTTYMAKGRTVEASPWLVRPASCSRNKTQIQNIFTDILAI